eukprot:gene21833-28861_t
MQYPSTSSSFSPSSSPSVALPRALLLLLLALSCVCGGEGAQPSAGRSGSGPLNVDDFIIVAPTSLPRLPLVHATRNFRLGVRTYIMVESQKLADKLGSTEDAKKYKETYTYWPDRKFKEEAGRKVGDNRWLVSPFLAHNHYGNTDYLVDEYQRPGRTKRSYVRRSNMGATCLPCHTPNEVVERMQAKYWLEGLKTDPWRGCPCTRQQSCAHRAALCREKKIKDKDFCSLKESNQWDLNLSSSTMHPFNSGGAGIRGADRAGGSCDHTWPNGGAGNVMSAKLMGMIGWDAKVKKYVDDFDRPCCAHQSGDWGFAKLLHDYGFGITQPEFSAAFDTTLLSEPYLVFNPSSHNSHLMWPHKLADSKQAGSETRSGSVAEGGAGSDSASASGGEGGGLGHESFHVHEWTIRNAVSIHVSVHTAPHYGNISSAASMMSKMAWSHKHPDLQSERRDDSYCDCEAETSLHP